MGQASTRSLLLLGAVALGFGMAIGCGVSDATEGLFAPNGTGRASGAGGATSTTTGTGATTTTSGGGATTSTTSSGHGGGATTTTTTTTTTSSTSTGGPVEVLDCGAGLTCPLGPNSGCCWDSFGTSGQTPGTCVKGPPSQATCNTSTTGLQTLIECEHPDQCTGGQTCCGHREASGNVIRYVTVSCQTKCDWPDVVICDPMHPVCPVVTSQTQGTVQTVCKPSGRLPRNYSVCTLP